MPPPPKQPSTTAIAHTLLSRAHSPDTAQRIYTEKILQRPLHLKPTSTPPNTLLQRREARLQKRASRARKRKLKPKPLSARQKRSLGLYTIPPSAQKHAIYEPLHRMWLGYIREVLGIDELGNGGDGREVVVSPAAAAKLCSADYHGAEVEVVRSRCVGRVGVKGIVVRDGKFVFEVVTRGDRVKILPKEHTVFRFVVPRSGKEMLVEDLGSALEGGDGGEKDAAKAAEVSSTATASAGKKPDLVFELHGDQFIYRAADRANRKFKTHFLPDL